MYINKILSIFVLALAMGTTAGMPAGAPDLLPPATPLPFRDGWNVDDFAPSQGCSTVYATDGTQMLGGNNEDSGEPLTKVWFVPPGEDTYGLVFFGYGNYRAQGGMNDQGLFFDFQSVNKELPVITEGKELYPGTNYIVYDAIATCATVDCVVEMFEKYYDRERLSYQHLFGDATGESVIIEPQAILRQSGGFQVATNFYQSTVPEEQRRGACTRFRTATEMLEGSPPLSVEYMREVMDAVHQDEQRSPTVYTNVYDLANRLVYLYQFFDYEHVVVLDLAVELAKGAHAYDLPALFPPNPTAQAYNAPLLADYADVVQSQRIEVDPAFLAAYVGEYAPFEEEPRPAGDWVSVVPNGTSLMMIFPDSHRYELFPRGETSFYVVTWDKMSESFQVQFEVEFGLDDATGQVLYMDWVFGPGEGGYVRNDRLNLDSYVPYLPAPAPTATLTPTRMPPPTATVAPTQAPSAMPLDPPPTITASTSDAGYPWGWLILPVAVLAALVGWLVIRRRRSIQR